MNRTLPAKVTAFFGSRRFFYGVIAFFLLETLWIACSAVYPMAFDENFHFGIIQIYSRHWLPFLTSQPPGASAYGAVAHDPSYFYHYLMSFPYRLIAHFAHDQTLQIIWLRFVNVGLFVSALLLFRRVLLRANVSPALTHLSILLFALIPIVPLLAAQINYDNLTILIVAWTCLLMEHIFAAIRSKKVPLRDIALLAVLALLGSIVKYALMPIFLACAIMTAIAVWHYFKHSWRAIWKAACVGFRAYGIFTKATLAGLLLISIVLFSQRYLLNLAAYKTPIPNCDRVLTVDDCMSYGPWARSYIDKRYKSNTFKPSVAHYVPLWFYGMWYRLFFTVNGSIPQPPWAINETFPPLLLPSFGAVAFFMVSFVLVAKRWRRLFWGNWMLSFFIVMSLLYVAALFADNFASYASTGQPVAINGRYLLPILLPVLAIAARAWELALAGRQGLKALAAALAVVLFLQGGGVFTFMVNSNYTWYWPDHRIQTANWYAHDVVHKVIFDYQPPFILSP